MKGGEFVSFLVQEARRARLCDGSRNMEAAIACGKRSQGTLCAVVGKGATSGPSQTPSPHYSIHEAKALRVPLGMNEHVPPFS